MNTFLIILVFLLSYPFSHIILKKAMLIDNNLSEKKYSFFKKLFYVPVLNLIISFLYILWSVIVFKKD
jgi:hypothetical protein